MSEIEIMARIERRRKWTPAEKAALLAEVEAAGGRVKPVAQRHRIAESVLYNWRAAKKAAAEACAGSSGSVAFVPVGMIGEAGRWCHRWTCHGRGPWGRAALGRSRSSWPRAAGFGLMGL